jgi:hypothetical protein
MTMGNPHQGTSSAIWRAGLLRELHKLSSQPITIGANSRLDAGCYQQGE